MPKKGHTPKKSCGDDTYTDEAIGSKLSPILRSILDERVRLNPNQKQRNVRIVNSFLDVLTRKMKEIDVLFEILFQNIYYTGSYYDGLRVQEATEFDVNLVLNLPKQLKGSNCKIEEDCLSPSFAKYHLLKTAETLLADLPNWPKLKQVRKFLDEDNYFIPEEVRKWLQSLVDKVFKNCNLQIPGVERASISQHGPAKTIQLKTTEGEVIDLDLVPVICSSGGQTNWPESAQTKLLYEFNIPERDRFYFMVPKGSDDRRLWRLHFPEVEKNIIHDTGCIKPLIRLLKLFRDKQNWKSIASYFLKTVVMWEVVENRDRSFWKNDKLGSRFIMLLKRLRMYLERRYLPYLLYPEFNLFKDITSAEANNISQRLKRIIADIEKNPENIRSHMI